MSKQQKLTVLAVMLFVMASSSVDAQQIKGNQEDPCKVKGRVVGDEGYCDRYWECVSNQPELYDCPNGLVFAGKHRGVTEGCDYPWRANYCEGKQLANGPLSTEHCDWLYGIFGHETSCTRYWTCWNGTATEQLCIGGLLYNENAHSCDWPENVDGCQKHHFIVALKDVSVTIPQAVKRGSNALLTCNYDMENDTLYSVKWYKGRREFYRYTPKENPAMKVFPMIAGLTVERNLSNQSHVVLLAVPLNISGKFTCEISVEAPTFQTAMVSGEMEVVELPEQQAIVTGIQPRYRIGDLVDGNCSIKFSKPAANLTWTINGIVVPPHHIKTYQIEKYEDNNLESVVSAIHFMVTTQHFLKGQMRLKCTASIFDIFKEEIESIIEEDRPRIMASGRSYDMNNYPYEPHSSGDGFEDHNESYLTYYSAADINSAAAPTTTKTYKIFGNMVQKRLQHIWTIICCCYASIKTTTTNDDAKLTVLTRTTTTTTIAEKTWQQQLKQLQQTVKQNAAQILVQLRIWQSYYLKDIVSNYYSGNRNSNAIATTTTTTGIGFGIARTIGAATIIIILLTHHFISCQNRCDTKEERAAATATATAAKAAKATMTTQKILLSDTLSKVVVAAATTTTTTTAMPTTLLLSTTVATTIAKRTYDNNSSRKSFYNCSSASAEKTKALTTNPLQKLEQQRQQRQQKTTMTTTMKRSCYCHQCTNQNDSASNVIGVINKNIATAMTSDCQQEQQQKLHQELSLTLAVSVASETTKIECNFVKNMMQKKDQTLLMSVQQQQQQEQQQQQRICHFNFSAATFKMPSMLTTSMTAAATKTFHQC